MEAVIAETVRCVRPTNINIPMRPSPANNQCLATAIETGLAALRNRLIPPPPPPSSDPIPSKSEDKEEKPTDGKDPFDFLGTEAVVADPPSHLEDAVKKEDEHSEEHDKSSVLPVVVDAKDESVITATEDPEDEEETKSETADKDKEEEETKSETADKEPERKKEDDADAQPIEDQWNEPNEEDKNDKKDPEEEEKNVPDGNVKEEEAEEQQPLPQKRKRESDDEQEVPKKRSKNKDAARSKFIDDECEETSEEDGSEAEDEDEEGGNDDEMKDFIVPDSEVELLEDDEETFEEMKEREKKKKAKKSEEEEDPAALEAKAKEEAKIRQALGPFFGSLGGRTVEKQKEIIDVVLKQNERQKKIRNRLRPTSASPSVKIEKEDGAGKKQPQPQQRRNLSICREITNDLFFDWGTVAATCVGFKECYGGDVQAEAPLKNYHSGAGQGLSMLYRKIREARSEECVERDLDALCEVIAEVSGDASKAVPGGKKRSRQTLSDVQELIRRAGKATLLECFCAPDNCPDDAFVQTACRGYLCKPRQIVMVKMETPADGYKVDKAVVLVPKAIAVLLEAVHSLLQVEAFITRSPEVIAWAAKNRDAFKNETKTPNQIRADLAPTFERIWREWATLRKNFCAQF